MDDFQAAVDRDGTSKHFFYLIVSRKTGSVVERDIQQFFRTGSRLGKDFVFVVLDRDYRDDLYEELEHMEGGEEFWEKIGALPLALLYSERPLQKIKDVADIQFFAVREYDTDTSVIYDQVGVHNRAVRMRAIAALEYMNRVMKLEPVLYPGVALKLNEVLKDALDALKRNSL